MNEENKGREKKIEEKKEIKEEKKIEEIIEKKEPEKEKKKEPKVEGKEKEKAEEKKKEEKGKKEKKKEEPKMVKKDKAIARGKDLQISTKHAIAICNFIRKKKIEKSILYLEQVMEKKKAMPMKGEIPHRKGKDVKIGRYPFQASKVFIKLLKSLAANCSINGLENPYISTAKADIAYRPHKRFGQGRSKRTHVLLIAEEEKTKEAKN